MTSDRVTEQSLGGTDEKQKHRPPLPKPLYYVVNPAIKALLYSPLHRLLSRSLMVLSFQGRRSGKRYAIPVGYVRKGNRLFIFSHSDWSKNFRGGSQVAVRLQGQTIRGNATSLEDGPAVIEAVHAIVEKHGEAMAQRMGVLPQDGSLATFTDVPNGTVLIEITLEDDQR